jgi:beta-lactamase class D
MEEIIRLINAYWKFDNDQQHLSTWHDKQDLLEAIRQAKIWDKPAVSNCTHEKTTFRNIRCDCCDDCGEIVTIDV